MLIFQKNIALQNHTKASKMLINMYKIYIVIHVFLKIIFD